MLHGQLTATVEIHPHFFQPKIMSKLYLQGKHVFTFLEIISRIELIH
jgi:hypothetical protein